ncbi:hypothetical protein [Spirillospora sp. CA-128828]|uniref:hypothetical protein n=1 Tax=Spirillospora sp. CA-128828 TaxID=3240033 RepID=UPI003D8DCDF4
MARRDYGHASRSQTHAAPWAETPGRPSSRSEPKRGLWSEEPQWPEGSWWSEQPDWSERGRPSRREPSRREMKRREGRARTRRSGEGAERPRARARRPEPPAQRSDVFGARNGGSDAGTDRSDPRGGGFKARNERPGARTRPYDARDERTDTRTPQFGTRNEPSDARTRQFDARDVRSEPPTPQFGTRNEPPGARTRQFDAREERPGGRARPSGPGSERPDARTRQFDLRNERPGGRAERFDARAEGYGAAGGRSGRDRSRDFPPPGGRSRRRERGRSERGPERRPQGRPEPRGRQTPPRPGPKATPRRGRRRTDRMGIGAIVLSTAVGLSLLGIVERALLDGGPIGGSSGPVGSQRAIQPPKPGTGTSARPQQPSQQPGGGGTATAPAGPDLAVLAAQVRKLTLAQRGTAARQAYGAALTRNPFVDATRTSADRTWVFGTTAIPVPAASSANPEIAFYTAHWTGKEWQVGLSGGRAFAAMLGTLPANMMSASEARLLRKYGALTAAQATALVNGTRTGDKLMLPWKIGQAWSLTTSDDSPSARPLASLAFSGGDGRVVASGLGRLYRFCSSQAGALVMLIHPSGLATTYYGMRNVTQLRDGSVVEQGDVLGRTGTSRPCGGAPAPRAEVAFGLRRGAAPIALDGAVIGGWTFRERAKPLLGFAERGVLQVLPGALLANLGPVPAADDPPSSSPSPRATPEDGAGPAAAPAPAAT